MPSVSQEELVASSGNTQQGVQVPCGILGGNCDSLVASGHNCPECDCLVHNLCHQRLRRSGDRGPNGMMCGGDACKSTMNDSDKAAQLQIRDGGLKDSASSSTPPTTSPPLEDPSAAEATCSAGAHCVEPSDSDAKLTVKCPHGLPRHFGCVQVPCTYLCGGGSASAGGKKSIVRAYYE